MEAPLYVKALSSDSAKPFWMSFQQIKPVCCDVIVWVAVWRDVIRYWVFSSNEVESDPHYSKGQHRGNVGEGQLRVTHENIHAFDSFQVQPNKLADAIREACQREQAARNPR